MHVLFISLLANYISLWQTGLNHAKHSLSFHLKSQAGLHQRCRQCSFLSLPLSCWPEHQSVNSTCSPVLVHFHTPSWNVYFSCKNDLVLHCHHSYAICFRKNCFLFLQFLAQWLHEAIENTIRIISCEFTIRWVSLHIDAVRILIHIVRLACAPGYEIKLIASPRPFPYSLLKCLCSK